MATPILDQLILVLQGLKTDATNLNKSLDDRDVREETKGDLAQVFSRFGELKSLMAKASASDVEKIQDEFKQLMSGQEDVHEYNQDITAILASIKKRTEASEATKTKVTENLPKEQKTEGVASLLDNFKDVLNGVQGFLDQSGVGTR